MKLYLVWNEAKTECVGFDHVKKANYAIRKYWDGHNMIFTELADEWLELHGDEECTIQEIEV